MDNSKINYSLSVKSEESSSSIDAHTRLSFEALLEQLTLRNWKKCIEVIEYNPLVASFMDMEGKIALHYALGNTYTYIFILLRIFLNYS
jgi:hypothetical protein